jgi:hypothetical protein
MNRAWRKPFWLLLAVTGLLYATMALWAVPKLIGASRMVPGDLPFDLRMFGYSHAEAQDYITSLTPGGHVFYVDTLMRLDSVFPAMLTVVLIAGGWWLLAGKAMVLKVALAVIALGYGLFDYLENAAVYRMMTTDGGAEALSAALVATASQYTVLKFFFLDAVLTAIIVLAVARLIARWQRGRT